MRFLFLALLMVAGILGAVVLMQRGQARITAETTPPATATVATRQVEPGRPDDPGRPPAALPSPQTESMPADPVAAPTHAAAPDPVTEKPMAPKAPEPAAPAFQVVAKPAIVAAGILETTRGRVTLKDIAPLESATRCGEGAKAWPCGQLATTQLRRFLRGRSVNCDIADPAWEGAVTARCTLGREDVAAWLVENGWARAEPGSPYEAAGRAAEAAGRGIFGADPRQQP